MYKKDDSAKVKNVGSVNVLLIVSKNFEWLMQEEIREYINQFPSPFTFGYKTPFSTQTTLVWLIDKCKHQLDKNGFVGTIKHLIV